MSQVQPFVGIDVAKDNLDLASRPGGESRRTRNREAEITQLVQGQQLQELRPALIVMEATGGLELPLAAALAVAGLPVAVVNPRQVRKFAEATGQLAKTNHLTRRSWPISPRPLSPHHGHCPMRRRNTWVRCWPAADSSSRC